MIPEGNPKMMPPTSEARLHIRYSSDGGDGEFPRQPPRTLRTDRRNWLPQLPCLRDEETAIPILDPWVIF